MSLIGASRGRLRGCRMAVAGGGGSQQRGAGRGAVDFHPLHRGAFARWGQWRFGGPSNQPGWTICPLQQHGGEFGSELRRQLCSQVFLRDRRSNTTTLVSVNLNGFAGNGSSTYGGMSPDGRYVVFTSDASDLVAGDSNGFSDIFVRDLVARTTVLASVSTSGVEGNGPSSYPVITPDGRYVAFISTSTNLAGGGKDNPDIFLRDLVAQTTVSMSSAATGSSTGAIISSLAISTNGRYVAFVSTATTLVLGVTQSGGEVYVRDFLGGGISWASSNATVTAKAILGGTATPASEHPVISDDGTWVAFKTGPLSVTTLPSLAVIFQYNSATAALTTVYTNGICVPYGNDFYGPEMTPDGRFIAFTSGEQRTTTNGSIRLWDSEAANQHPRQHKSQWRLFHQHAGPGAGGHTGRAIRGVPEQGGGFDDQCRFHRLAHFPM